MARDFQTLQWRNESYFSRKKYGAVSLPLPLYACQLLSWLLYYRRCQKSAKFAILYVKTRASSASVHHVVNYVISGGGDSLNSGSGWVT
jgi:hypothetical protein